MKKLLSLWFTVVLILCGCTPAAPKSGDAGVVPASEDPIVVGFSQSGAESDWRSANTTSMRETFTEENGYRLIYENGQQKQSNQTMSIRRFIQQGVDYIVVAPVTETGWDSALEEAKEAGIPVILVDRMVDVEDDELYTCWVGSDFELEADKVTAWLKEFTRVREIEPSSLHIVNIQGTLGASAQLGRTRGLERAAKKYGWDLVAESSGDFTQVKGREVMAALLEEHEEINVVYCENDNEALGAIEAIHAAGKEVGEDIESGEILVVSFDGINSEAMELLHLGQIGCIAECNPLHGPRVRAVIEMLEAGGVPDKKSYVTEGIYSADTSITQLSIGEESYSVTLV